MIEQSVCSIDKVKVLVLGESGVGKTSLVHLLTGQPAKNPGWTVGCTVEVLLHDYAAGTAQEEAYFVELWDLGGSKTLQSIRKLFMSGTHGYIFVHDLTNRKSLQNLKAVWLSELANCQISVPLPHPSLLVGTHHSIFTNSNGPGGGGINQHSTDTSLMYGFLPQWSTSMTTDNFCRNVGNCEAISVDCHSDKYVAPGTSNAVTISRFFDRVVSAKLTSQQSSSTHSTSYKREAFANSSR